jgi:hypothetical protein
MMPKPQPDESISGILNTGPVIAQSYGRWLGTLVMLFALSRHHRRFPIAIASILAAFTGAKWAGWL